MKKLYTFALALMVAAFTAANAQSPTVALFNADTFGAAGGSACTLGTVNAPLSQAVCPNEFAIFDFVDFEIPEGGGMGILFISAGGFGGANGLALLGIHNVLPAPINSALGGLLAQNELDPMEGDWLMIGFIYEDEEDVEATICAEAGLDQFIMVDFLASDDVACGGTSIVEAAPSAFGVSFYPNPATDTVTLTFNPAETAMVDVMIVSAFGKVVYRTNELAAPGLTRVINVADLAAGQYVVRISSAMGAETHKLMIVRR